MERLFALRCKLIRELLRADICEGMDPVISLLFRKDKNCSFVSADISDGIVLERLFSYRRKLVRSVSALIDEDMVPRKLFVFKSNDDTDSPLQFTPIDAV